MRPFFSDRAAPLRRTVALVLLTAAAVRAEEQVFLTPDEALRLAFPSSERVVAETRRLTPAQKAGVEKRLGWRLRSDVLDVHKGLTGDRVDGYAVITEEIGKHEPITFLVKAAPDFRVERVDVLVYRESHGGEVRREKFLGQFRGKDAGSPLRAGRDVENITGATLSVKAVAAGVKRVLCELEAVYGSPAPRP